MGGGGEYLCTCDRVLVNKVGLQLHELLVLTPWR
jgi:hypothetical protein